MFSPPGPLTPTDTSVDEAAEATAGNSSAEQSHPPPDAARVASPLPAAAGNPQEQPQNRASHPVSVGTLGVCHSAVREVGCQATWSLSSCKPGFGVDQLRDDTVETYWQSDGQLPHLVNIQFRRKVTVHDVAVYTDFKLDESYTPSKISVRCGTNFNDLQEIEVVELNEPAGWVVIPLKDLNDRLVRTFMVQIAVIANHQQGRDTHLRQIKIHSPMEEKKVTAAAQQMANWNTTEMLQFVNVR